MNERELIKWLNKKIREVEKRKFKCNKAGGTELAHEYKGMATAYAAVITKLEEHL